MSPITELRLTVFRVSEELTETRRGDCLFGQIGACSEEKVGIRRWQESALGVSRQMKVIPNGSRCFRIRSYGMDPFCPGHGPVCVDSDGILSYYRDRRNPLLWWIP